jgi:hydrogenase nickel incorporation protein HypA/HybF
MHELALMDEACRLAQAAAARDGATRITRIWLRLGDCCGVDADALRLAFAVMQEQQCWHQTQLELELVPTRCRCLRCQCEYRPVDLIAVCPQCGGLQAERVSGQELELVGVEVA